MRSAVPQKFRSGKAARNSVANFLTSSRPRRGACMEYSKRMSGAASSSMMAGFHGFPQNWVNQRATIALFSSDIVVSSRRVRNPSTLTWAPRNLPPVRIGRSPVGVVSPRPVDAAVGENVRWNSWMFGWRQWDEADVPGRISMSRDATNLLTDHLDELLEGGNLLVPPPDGRQLRRHPQVVGLPQHHAVRLRLLRRRDSERDPDAVSHQAQHCRGVVHFLSQDERQSRTGGERIVHEPEDVLGAERCCADASAEGCQRVLDGGGKRGRWRQGAALAHALDPERIPRARRFKVGDAHRRH